MEWAKHILDTQESKNILLLSKQIWGKTDRQSTRTVSDTQVSSENMREWVWYPISLTAGITCKTQQGGTTECSYRNYGNGLEKN